MPKRNHKRVIKDLFPEGSKPIRGGQIDLGKTKTVSKGKWKRQKRDNGRDGGFIQNETVIEDGAGAKWKRRSIRTAPDQVGGTKDLAEANNRERGYYGQAGKGDAPRNLGPNFHKNFKKIKGMTKREDGVVRGGKWKKVYK